MDRKTIQTHLNAAQPPLFLAHLIDRATDVFWAASSMATGSAALLVRHPQLSFELPYLAFCATSVGATWIAMRLGQNRRTEVWVKEQSPDFLANISQIVSRGDRLTVGFFRRGRLKQIVDHELAAHNQHAANRAAFWRALGITPSTPQP